MIATALLTAVTIMGVSGSTTFADTTNTNVKQGQPTQSSTPAPVTVQPGDTLTKIAATNNTTYIRLFDANTSINNPNLIFPGQQLTVPAPDAKLTNRPLPTAVKVAAKAAGQSHAIASAATVADGSVWDRLAKCESGGNWAANTGNGFYGGLQFTQSSWAAVGGSGNPASASREEQISRAQMLQARQGWGAWPTCSAKLGLN